MKFKYIALTILGLGVIVVAFLFFIKSESEYSCGYRLTKAEVRELTQKAEHGDSDACSRLRFHYEDSGDKEKVFYWIRKGATFGDPLAQYSMFYELIKDKNPRHHKEAVEQLEMSALSNYPNAQLKLGELYRDGDIIASDVSDAEYWFQRAANNGHIGGMLALSQLLTRNNTRSGLVEAYKWALIALLRAEPKSILENKIALHQKIILNEIGRLGYSASEIKREAESRMKVEEKHIPNYAQIIPAYGSPKCNENGQRIVRQQEGEIVIVDKEKAK